MTDNNIISPYRDSNRSMALYQVPALVVDGEKLLYYALYGNEAYEQLRKFFLGTFNFFNIYHSYSKAF
jgi:hypothetical protein